MSLLTDIRAVSENAIEQLADRFSDLPRPLLAAIGAGDIAVGRLAALREQLDQQLAGNPLAGAPTTLRTARGRAGDLPARAQKMIAELPTTLSEIGAQLKPDTVKETVEAYTHLFGMIYGNLASRGDQTLSKVRSTGLRPGTVVDAAPSTPPPTAGPNVSASPGPRPPAAAKAPRSAAKSAAKAPTAGQGPGRPRTVKS